MLQYPATTYPDLHQDIAYAYYDKRHFDLALQVFQRIIDVSDVSGRTLERLDLHTKDVSTGGTNGSGY